MFRINSKIKKHKSHDITLRDRFIARVLVPPFILLLLIGGLGFWQLNNFLTEQAVNDLRVAATTTSIRLERELSIRDTVLKNTGEEITATKNSYVTDLALLQRDRSACREHYTTNYSFNGSPENACDRFVTSSRPSLEQIENIYIESAKQLQQAEIDQVNQRISAYKQFFPETMAILVIDDSGEILSSAVSGNSTIIGSALSQLASEQNEALLMGSTIEIDGLFLSVFSSPMPDGFVLAAYDVNNDNFVKPAWRATPINNQEASSIVVETGNAIVFPRVRNEIELLSETSTIAPNSSAVKQLAGIRNIVVSEPVGDSKWTVLVASPEALVLGPARDAQFIAFIVSGLFLIGFLWVGTFFIKRTTDNIAKLVTGAMIYGSGRLDYKLDISKSEKEFKQLADTMNYMARRLAETEKENDERNKEFISIATHELRAPMTSIIGYISMFKENMDKKLNKQNTMLLDSAFDGTLQLRDLITDMLDAARLEGGREEFSIKKVKLSDFVKDCLDSMKLVADENKVTLKYDPKDSSEVLADEAKLRIIINNFVSNAIKYSHKNGHVKVTHSKNNGLLVTAIANSGPAIPENQKQHMFEKFFRVDTPEHRKVTGTGIGMFVTKQYILAMRGEVWFESETGKDTVFYFSLPLAQGVKIINNAPKITPKPNSSKWIMRWRRRLR